VDEGPLDESREAAILQHGPGEGHEQFAGPLSVLVEVLPSVVAVSDREFTVEQRRDDPPETW